MELAVDLAKPTKPIVRHTYDDATGVYRYRNGREVPLWRIKAEMDRVGEKYFKRAMRLLRKVADGKMPLSVAQGAMAANLKAYSLQTYALGAGGVGNLASRDYGALGGHLRAEYRFLSLFLGDVSDGGLSAAQIEARMRLYLGSAESLYYTAQGSHLIAPSGFAWLERRILHPSDRTCEDCVIYAAKEWQPLGTLPAPGTDSRCLGNCKCDMQRQLVPVNELAQYLGEL